MKNISKNKLKVYIAMTLMMALTISNIVSIYGEGPVVSGKSAILVDVDTGEVIYEKDAYTKRQIASVTKIMTGFLVAEEGNLDSSVYIGRESATVGGTSFQIKEGMMLSRRDLLHGLLYVSGNDAGDALARASSLGYDGFIKKMNEKAISLGMGSTMFFDPHGLGSYGKAGASNNYSTAYDLSILMRTAMGNPEFAEIQGKKNVKTGNPKYPMLSNGNLFTRNYYGALGAKTGYTGNAGNCIVVMARRNEKTLVGVILATPKGTRDKDINNLMDYGFNKIKNSSKSTSSQEYNYSNLTYNAAQDPYSYENLVLSQTK
ncbi:MAG: D-alanyl-D-alanine carboxypeptidase family protein [Filifactoraceae bacterium]